MKTLIHLKGHGNTSFHFHPQHAIFSLWAGIRVGGAGGIDTRFTGALERVGRVDVPMSTNRGRMSHRGCNHVRNSHTAAIGTIDD